MVYIIRVHSIEYDKDLYAASDSDFNSSGLPVMSSSLEHAYEFKSVKEAQSFVKEAWGFLRLDSGRYDLNTLCICEKRLIPVSYYKG